MKRPAIIDRVLERRRLLLALSLVAVVGGGLAASTLPVRADFSALLPPSTESVRHLEAIQRRVRAFGTAFILVESDSAALRARASQEIRTQVEKLEGGLVARVSGDDGPLRRFVWAHRHLFASLEDLTRARDALAERIARAKLEANPLYIDLEDPAPAGRDPALDDLERRLAEAEARGKAPTPFVSRDGRLQLLVVQASFPASEISRTRALAGELERILDDARRRHPEIRVGLTGDVATTLSEQRSILVGMLRAAAITVGLCTLLLALAYRSTAGIAAVLWALAAGTLATLAVTRLLVGHLNVATAFLAAIVVGNGINPGLILLSRYRDELRRGDPAGAIARAMAGAARGTLTASATAAVAYLSLAVTDFRGFRHFGIIGGIGMILCWVAAFTVLPAALAELQARGRIRFRPPAIRARRLGSLVPRGAGLAAALGLAAAFAAGIGTYRFLAGDPLEKDWRRLRSDSAEILAQRAWNDRISTDFDQGFNRNLSGRFAIVVPRRDQVKPLVEALRARDRGLPPERALLSEVRSIDDLLPAQQVEKLALLGEIRRMIDEEVAGELEGKEREEILRLRPPDHLRAIGDRDVPAELAWPFIERDGTVGRIILAAKADRFDGWNVDDLVEFTGEIAGVPRPEGTLLGGQAFVFADMLRIMKRDGPRAVALSLIGSALTVIVLLGAGRHGWVTILCAAAGSAGMIAIAGAVGVKVNFLDFIALPLTIGIGADYAANMAAREREEGGRDRAGALVAAAGAVLLCSLTTIIGYGSLLGSDNAGIRSFGLAAIIGEVTCLAAALLLCPALLASRRPRG
ncbi:MAG TPA: MMPL family transporter [Kofleriaceae bacterium]|nr:MMPL family transporter [Kofleriaceae bacterium]